MFEEEPLISEDEEVDIMDEEMDEVPEDDEEEEEEHVEAVVPRAPRSVPMSNGAAANGKGAARGDGAAAVTDAANNLMQLLEAVEQVSRGNGTVSRSFLELCVRVLGRGSDLWFGQEGVLCHSKCGCGCRKQSIWSAASMADGIGKVGLVS